MLESSNVSEMQASLPSCHLVISVRGGSAACRPATSSAAAARLSVKRLCMRTSRPIYGHFFAKFVRAQIRRVPAKIVIHVRQFHSCVHRLTAGLQAKIEAGGVIHRVRR